jgi:hypothetical protein
VADIWGFAESTEKPIRVHEEKTPNINHCESEK